MSEIVSIGVTMSSREIAELTGKRHDNVTADIRKMLSELCFDPLNFQGIYRDSNNREQQEHRLPKRESLILVSGYSISMRARIIDRWQELEAKEISSVDPLQALMDPVVLRSLLLGYSQKVEGLASTIAIQAPKVAAFDRFATVTDGTYSLRESAKSLQVKPKWLIGWMVERRWIYRHPDGGRWLAFQPRLDSSLLEHKVVTGQRNDGTDWGTTQVRVTAKGLARIAELLARDRAEGN